MSNQTVNVTSYPNRCINPKFDVYFGIQNFFVTLTDVFAFSINLSFLYTLCYCATLQPNVRLMLQNISVGFLCQSFNGICQTVYHVFVFTIGYRKVFDTPQICVLFQLPGTLGTSCVIFSFLFIAIDRLVGTVIGNQKETQKSGPLNKLMAVLTWFTGIPILVEPIIKSRNWIVCYCNLSFVTRDFDLYITTSVYILIQVVAIVLYPTVCYLNKRELSKFGLYSKEHSLVERSQAWRNVRTTLMLLPSAILQGCLFVMALALKLPTQKLVFSVDLSNGLDIRISMIWAQLFSIFCAIHPILCIRRNHMVAKTVIEKSRFLSIFAVSVKVDVVGERENFSMNPDNHQHQLLSFWESTRPGKPVKK